MADARVKNSRPSNWRAWFLCHERDMRLVATPDAREDHAIGVEHRDSPLAKCQRPVEGSLAWVLSNRLPQKPVHEDSSA